MHVRTSLVALCAAVTIAGVPPGCPRAARGRPAAEWIKTLESSERLAGLKIAEIVSERQLPQDS
jgi:hypothetical protein